MTDTNIPERSKKRPANKIRQPQQGGIRPRSGGKNRFAVRRATMRREEDATKALQDHLTTVFPSKKDEVAVDPTGKLKITILGGHEEAGEKNMAILEYGDDAVIVDCGNRLGINLPGINYAINDITYLDSIKSKIRGYLITHGHLDHMGGLRHTVPKYPAPIFGSRYTNGVIEKSFADDETGLGYKPQLVTIDLENHATHRVGIFGVEFIRVTHSVPDPAAICIETPVGKVLFTGDFRIDPEPLDKKHCDTARLIELGNEGVLVMLSDSTYADAPGRVPTEQTLQQSFHDIIGNAPGRIFVALFSSNMNRTQMIINSAIKDGRKIALDGRGMLAYSEIAVKQGILRVPQDLIIPMGQIGSLPDKKILVMCTGSQGEPNAALSRMSNGEHRFANLKEGDTVVISSSPIPGNEIRYEDNSNRLTRRGVHLFRHPTHEVDGCGPLHVSGHARREELREMLTMVRPRFFIPSYAGIVRRHYHGEIAVEEGMSPKDVLHLENGETIYFTDSKAIPGNGVPHGSVLVDQNGNVVSGYVVRDRIMLSEQGMFAVTLTLTRNAGKLVAAPDIITLGFVDGRDAHALTSIVRQELGRRLENGFDVRDADRFKNQLREALSNVIFEKTRRTPVIVVNLNPTEKDGL